MGRLRDRAPACQIRRMTLHMIKLCVGAASIDDLAEWQKGRMAARKKAGHKPQPYHTTFQSPKKQAELLDGGSLYWVMKSLITVRQRFVGFEDGHKEDGSPCCMLILDPKLIPVRPAPRRAFQGWRYLLPDDAPADLKRGDSNTIAEMPLKMRKDLADLGLI
jgi:hypothetical protein